MNEDKSLNEDKSIDGLPVPGYRPQKPEAVAAVTVMKAIEEQVLQLLDAVENDPDLDVDKRWLAIGRTAIEQGFMAVNRSIFKPERVTLAGPSFAEQLAE